MLLTGGTGFLGKVIAERLLRAAPEIERIYLLIRPQRDAAAPVSAYTRFDTEVLGSGVFSALERIHGPRWPSFVREKVVPVTGDVSQPDLGLSPRDQADLAASVDILINAAASVTFDAPLDEALRHNVWSASHVASFARRCRSAALVHISTAYVAGRRTGTVMEAPLDASSDELDAVEDAVRARRGCLIEEGTARARRLGWHDTYTYTKALGELALERARGHVRAAIVRPTIIESSLRDPEPGWLENLNVGDPIWVEYGRGRMPDFPFGVDAVYDIVPVDLVANAVLATLPAIGTTLDTAYYAVGSGALNPITGADIYELTCEYFSRHPMLDRRGQPIVPPRLTFPTLERFREMYGDQARRSATMKRLLYLAEIYETYMNGGCTFDTSNTQRLLAELDPSDREAFGFDVRAIDWRTYIQDVHLPGLRRHVLRDRRSSVSSTGPVGIPSKSVHRRAAKS